MAVFVPASGAGRHPVRKIIKIAKSYAIGKLQEILTPSTNRITPDCPQFPKCGGCEFRHLRYEAELRSKEQRVRERDLPYRRVFHQNCPSNSRRSATGPLPEQSADPNRPFRRWCAPHGFLCTPQPSNHRLHGLPAATRKHSQGYS